VKRASWAFIALATTAGATALGASVVRSESQAPYRGSSFREIRALVFDSDAVHSDDPVAEAERENYRKGILPVLPVSWETLWRKTQHGLVNLLAKRAKATLAEHADYYERLEKVVHPTGICFAGDWRITEPTPYDGYFATGARGFLIARASSASGANVAGQKRPFGFAGKIFPTENPDAVVETINFVTIDNLAGTLAAHYLDVIPTNVPPTGFTFIPVQTLETFFALRAADSNITSRPIRQIGEWNSGKSGRARSPKRMFLKAAAGTPRIDEPDFRRELDVSRYPGGIVLEIYASSDTSGAGEQTLLGKATLTESKVSYACDRQLHFNHERASR
jgi:hypothetical protein